MGAEAVAVARAAAVAVRREIRGEQRFAGIPRHGILA